MQVRFAATGRAFRSNPKLSEGQNLQVTARAEISFCKTCTILSSLDYRGHFVLKLAALHYMNLDPRSCKIGNRKCV